jgi:hypothetical protein
MQQAHQGVIGGNYKGGTTTCKIFQARLWWNLFKDVLSTQDIQI